MSTLTIKPKGKRMQFIKRITEGERMPPFYGLAWQEIYARRMVCLPVPFNLLAAIGLACWVFLKHGWRGVHANPYHAYDQGRRDERAARGTR